MIEVGRKAKISQWWKVQCWG